MKDNPKYSDYKKYLESKKYLKSLAIVVIFFITAVTLKFTSGVLLPIVFACFVMLILYPLLEKLDKLHFPFWLSNTIGILLFFAFLLVVGVLVFMVIERLLIGIPAYGSRIPFDKLRDRDSLSIT